MALLQVPTFDLLQGDTLDDKIVNLWTGKPPNFGEYTGMRTFQSSLSEYGVNKDLKYLTKLFQNKVPSYTMSVRLPRTFPRREYVATGGFGSEVQADLAFMPPYPEDNDAVNQMIGFLCVVDIFSRRIWAEPISNKKSDDIEKILDNIFKNEIKSYPVIFESDMGGEFLGMKNYFEKHNIRFHIKQGKIKAGFSEYAIYLIKRRLYCALREGLTRNWIDLLPEVIQVINATPRHYLGGLTPDTFSSPFDNHILDDRIGISHLPPFNTWWNNRETYLSNESFLQKNDYVYANSYPDSKFSKSFDVQVSQFANTFLSVSLSLSVSVSHSLKGTASLCSL